MSYDPQTKKPFQSISLDLDEDIERMARSKGVPKLSVDSPLTDHNPEEGTSATNAAAESAASTAPTPRDHLLSTKTTLPDYAMIELKIRAVKERVSVNHLVMLSLKAAGITIKDEDLIEDGRRLRGSRALPKPDRY